MLQGLMAIKIGMSQKFDENGRHIPVTMLKIDDNVILDKKEKKLLLGFKVVKEKSLNKPQSAFYKKNNLPFVKFTKEMACDNSDDFEIGKALDAQLFKDIKFVDVTSKTKGRGFSGVIKRHNFRSNRASHGISLSERAHGSTGGCQDPGRVWKNKKMAGHYGNAVRTIQNLKVIDVDSENKILFIGGAVPGPKGGLVLVKMAVKKGAQK